MELESDHYDVVVLGTGLAESIAAAALAKTGKTVLHLDPNEYYGSAQASLTLDELSQWCDARSNPSSSSSSSPYQQDQTSRFTHASTTPLTPQLEADRRRYALSLFPSVLPSRGPLIETLIKSDVSKYVSFRMLDSVSIWQAGEGGKGKARRVPGSKEEVFKDKSVGLVEKRRLMKFLMFAGGDFEEDPILQGKEAEPMSTFLAQSFQLPPHLAESITYAIAHCSSPSEPTLPALVRTRRYLRSLGRYGSGAFLVGQYGGAGEVAQGFCRACAVYGGTYVLGPSAQYTSLEITSDPDKPIKLDLPCHPRAVTASHLITSPDHLPPALLAHWSGGESRVTAHCIAVLPSLPESLKRQRAEGEEVGEEDDTAIVVFPPGREGEPLARGLMMGEGTGSCPAGQFVLYLSAICSSSSTSPESLLKPYLDRLHPSPLSSTFYSATAPSPEPTLDEKAGKAITLLEPYAGEHLVTEGMDWEAEQGERAFWRVVGGREGVAEGKGFFDKPESEAEEADAEEGMGEDM